MLIFNLFLFITMVVQSFDVALLQVLMPFTVFHTLLLFRFLHISEEFFTFCRHTSVIAFKLVWCKRNVGDTEDVDF